MTFTTNECTKIKEPFEHFQILNFLPHDFLANVHKHILETRFEEKETDIYKVNQSIDLKAISSSIEPSSLVELRDVLYSDAFRAFVSSKTGLQVSSTNIDLSINKYSQGCHLLNHDDVIGSRRVSFILYLPDPADPWLPDDGGGLEMYASKSYGTPLNEPMSIITPVWNSFIFFKVQPGYSFHSVQEVVAKKDRISISGWFHAPDGEQGVADGHNSTLSQLLNMNAYQKMIPTSPSVLSHPLNEAETLYLAEYLNPMYLTAGIIDQLNDLFCRDSFLLLSQLLNESTQKALLNILEQEDKECFHEYRVNQFNETGYPGLWEHGSGENEGWECIGPPHLRRYMVLRDSVRYLDSDPMNDSSTTSSKKQRITNNQRKQSFIILSQLSHLLKSVAFQKWLGMITTLLVKDCMGTARRFRPSLDYSLALSNPQPLIHVNLCLSKQHESWEDGSVGGYSSYSTTSHDEQDAAVYKSNDDDDILLTIPASWNQMSIVLRDSGVLHFIKYVSAMAPSSRWDIDAEYQYLDTETTEE